MLAITDEQLSFCWNKITLMRECGLVFIRVCVRFSFHFVVFKFALVKRVQAYVVIGTVTVKIQQKGEIYFGGMKS